MEVKLQTRPGEASRQIRQENGKEPVTKEERRRQVREDKIELSKEALAALRGEDPPKTEEADEETGRTEPTEKRQQEKLEELRMVRQMMDVVKEQNAQFKEQSEKQADAMKEALDKMKKCMKIAASMSKGHKVPPQDEKYLLENDPKTYMMAVMMQMMAEEKKKVKSELDDEDLEQKQETSGAEAVDAAGDVSTPEAGVEAAASAE